MASTCVHASSRSESYCKLDAKCHVVISMWACIISNRIQCHWSIYFERVHQPRLHKTLLAYSEDPFSAATGKSHSKHQWKGRGGQGIMGKGGKGWGKEGRGKETLLSTLLKLSFFLSNLNNSFLNYSQLFSHYNPLCSQPWLYLWRTPYLLWPNICAF